MEKHLRQDHFDAPIKYQCDICAVVLINKWHFKRHKDKHEKDKPDHLCTECGKAFWDKRQLGKHIKINHSAVDQTCNLCQEGKSGKKLYSEQGLKEHIKGVHNKKHSCPKCPWLGTDPERKRDHFRIEHLKYNRFMCSECNKTFTKNNAKYHYQQVHLKQTTRKINSEFFEKHKDVIIDRKLTDPDYPSDDYVNSLLESSKN